MIISRYPKEMSALDETEHEEVDGQITIAVPDTHVTESLAINGDPKRVKTRDASNGVRRFCKHCGHPVDIDD